MGQNPILRTETVGDILETKQCLLNFSMFCFEACSKEQLKIGEQVIPSKVTEEVLGDVAKWSAIRSLGISLMDVATG